MQITVDGKSGSSGMVQTMTTPSGDTLYGGGSNGWFTTELEVLEAMAERAQWTIEDYKNNVQGRRDSVARLASIRDAIAKLPERIGSQR
jgi:ABC-type sugar transport system substrate-binding protein